MKNKFLVIGVASVLLFLGSFIGSMLMLKTKMSQQALLAVFRILIIAVEMI